MTTATLRFALDLAISKTTQPHHKLIFQHNTERPRCSLVKVHDREIPEPEVIEIWDDTEYFDPGLWDYEDFAPKKKPQNIGLLVLTNYGTRAI